MILSRLPLLLVAACWTQAPEPATPTPPEAKPRPAARPKWRSSTTAATSDPAPVSQTPQDVARDLATQLRTNGTHLLPGFVAGPIVVLDLDAGSLNTVCDASALSAAQAWGRMLVDPSRAQPTCRPSGSAGTHFSCMQITHSTLIMIEIEDPDQWRIVSTIVGNMQTGRATLSSKLSQLRAQTSTATCP